METCSQGQSQRPQVSPHLGRGCPVDVRCRCGGSRPPPQLCAHCREHRPPGSQTFSRAWYLSTSQATDCGRWPQDQRWARRRTALTALSSGKSEPRRRKGMTRDTEKRGHVQHALRDSTSGLGFFWAQRTSRAGRTCDSRDPGDLLPGARLGHLSAAGWQEARPGSAHFSEVQGEVLISSTEQIPRAPFPSQVPANAQSEAASEPQLLLEGNAPSLRLPGVSRLPVAQEAPNALCLRGRGRLVEIRQTPKVIYRAAGRVNPLPTFSLLLQGNQNTEFS